MRKFIFLIKGTLKNVFLLDVFSDPSSRPAFAWAGAWIILGTLVYHYFEGWSWLDALYFCVVTLATVGYGDFTPTTPFTKLFTMLYILNGIGILLFFVNKVVEIRKERGAQKLAKLRQAQDETAQTD